MDQITPEVYLGNSSSATNISTLKNLGINKVLSIMDCGSPKYNDEDNITHKTISAADICSQNIIKYFGECLNFIKGKEKVLVHCMAGASRSASVVIAYLMWNNKMTFHHALNFVKEKRFVIYPNAGFKEQLQLFEKELVKNDYDIDKIKFEEIKWQPKSYGFL